MRPTDLIAVFAPRLTLYLDVVVALSRRDAAAMGFPGEWQEMEALRE